MLKFEELTQYIPDCENYVSNEDGKRTFVDACRGFVITCNCFMDCANAVECTGMKNLKKVEGKENDSNDRI